MHVHNHILQLHLKEKKKKRKENIYKPRYAMFYSPTGEWERKQEEGKTIHGFQHCACYCRLVMYTHTKQQSLLCYRNIKKQLWNIQKCFKKYVYWYIHMYTNWPITAKQTHKPFTCLCFFAEEVFSTDRCQNMECKMLFVPFFSF